MARTTVRRIVPASPEAVFAAFTEPNQIRPWHAPGPGSLEELNRFFT